MPGFSFTDRVRWVLQAAREEAARESVYGTILHPGACAAELSS